jgi:PAS domain S-box-containing protein
MSINNPSLQDPLLGAVVDSAMDAIITVDAEQKIVLFNRAAEQVFRVRREQALGSPLERFIPPRFRGAHRGHVEQFGRTGATSRRMGDVTTLWGLRADGEEFPLEASISQAREGGRVHFTVILRDITLRKQYEDTLKRQQQELRELSARVLEAREEEKTRIARELHDELGQLLTAVKMDIAWLGENLRAAAPGVTAKVREMGAMVDQTVGAARRISADLRPLLLDDLGLAAALEWLAKETSRRHGFAVNLTVDEACRQLAEPLASQVYRIVQECLTNVVRHAQAKKVDISLAKKRRDIEIRVADDGIGLSSADLEKKGSFGLVGIRERVYMLKGRVAFQGEPGKGTRIVAAVPIPATETDAVK